MLNPEIEARVAERALRETPPPWLAELLVELDNPEGEAR
jgi:hypothetical protein